MLSKSDMGGELDSRDGRGHGSCCWHPPDRHRSLCDLPYQVPGTSASATIILNVNLVRCRYAAAATIKSEIFTYAQARPGKYVCFCIISADYIVHCIITTENIKSPIILTSEMNDRLYFRHSGTRFLIQIAPPKMSTHITTRTVIPSDLSLETGVLS